MINRRALVISKCSDGETVRVLVGGVTVAEVSMSEWARALVAPSTHTPGGPRVLPMTPNPMAGDCLTDAQRSLKHTLIEKLNAERVLDGSHKEGSHKEGQ